MKTKILCLGLIIIAFHSNVIAQGRTYRDGKVKIVTNGFSQRGDSVYVDLFVTTTGASVGKNGTLDIIPILTNDTESMDLPEISIKSRRNYIGYNRAMALMSKKERQTYTPPYTIQKSENNNSHNIEYKYSLPYKKWMSTARLDVKIDLCGCGSSKEMSIQHLADNLSISSYQIIPHLIYLKPEVEQVKQREEKFELSLDFVANSAVLDMKLGKNSSELSKTCAMLDEVRAGKGVSVRMLTITGHASPEGSDELNMQLSKGRATALLNYIQKRYDYPPSVYSTHYAGEDWEGLTQMVRRSDMNYKQEVLSIIESYPDITDRKFALVKLADGESYRYMLDNMFPPLRRSVCVIDYDVTKFNVEEAKDVFQTHPQNLSLNEMFLIANTYKLGSLEFNDVLETAVRMFPQDETALLNAASAVLSRGDTVSGERYLKRIQIKRDTPEYNNAMGTLELLKGNYKQAEQYLKSEVLIGVKEAELNLEELSKVRDTQKATNKN
jgi:outer membrane protein OmpA-like peptidoglycan-associated protein